MTAIAYRAGILAVDRQVTWDSITSTTTKWRQIHVPGAGDCIVVMSGYAYGVDVIHEQLTKSAKGLGTDIGSMSKETRYGFLITKDLTVHGIWGDGRVGPAEHYENEYFAEGGALSFLLGAMAHGASAVEAVKLACDHCDGCGHGVDIIDVRKELNNEK